MSSVAHFICGSTGAGKTTYARALAERLQAQVFSIDEWMKTLYWMDAMPSNGIDWALERVVRCERQIWLITERLLRAGIPVILDLGYSKKEQRDRWRSWLGMAGLQSQLHFLDAPVEVRRARVQNRNSERGDTFEFEVDTATFDWMESFFERPAAVELAAATIVSN